MDYKAKFTVVKKRDMSTLKSHVPESTVRHKSEHVDAVISVMGEPQ